MSSQKIAAEQNKYYGLGAQKNAQNGAFNNIPEFKIIENKPFEPMRPRAAPIRMGIESRKKLEQRFKAKIRNGSKMHSSVLMPINPEKEKASRDEKEEWMLDLQEIYDKIHLELQKLIKYQQKQENYLKKDEETQEVQSQDDDTQTQPVLRGNARFKEVLERQMIETETMMERLQNGGDDKKGTSREGLIMAKQFRQSLKELHALMETVAITQVQKIFAQSFEFVRKIRQLRSSQLLKEIQSSTQRMEKVRLGNKLENVLSSQKTEYEQAKEQEKQKKLAEYTKLHKKYPYDTDIRYEEPTYFKSGNEKSFEIKQIFDQFASTQSTLQKKFLSQEQLKMGQQKDKRPKQQGKRGIYIPHDKESEEIEQQRQLAFTSACFFNQRQKVEQLFDKMNSIEGPKVDFDHKYKNINLYFKERKSLNNLYLGDTRLTNFLNTYEGKCKQIDQKRLKSQEEQHGLSIDSLNLVDLDFAEDQGQQGDQLPLAQTLTTAQEKNQTALNKVTRINQEIQKKLAEEEHQEKLLQIRKLGVEQNQNFWDQLLEKPGSSAHPRRMVKQKAQTSHGSRPTNMQVFSQERATSRGDTTSSNLYLTEPPMILEKDRQIWLEKQQRLILNAHPKNPTLKIAFSENKQQLYSQNNHFTTIPVNNINYLVRREQAKTSEISKRSSILSKQSIPNLNQVPEDNNFRETFFSNFFLFQDDASQQSSMQKSMSNTTNFTIRYPSTANQNQRTHKPFKPFGDN